MQIAMFDQDVNSLLRLKFPASVVLFDGEACHQSSGAQSKCTTTENEVIKMQFQQ